MYERFHQTVVNFLCIVVLHMNPPDNVDSTNQLLDDLIVVTRVHATRYTVNPTMQNSPKTVVLNRAMLMGVLLLVIAVLLTVHDRQNTC